MIELLALGLVFVMVWAVLFSPEVDWDDYEDDDA